MRPRVPDLLVERLALEELSADEAAGVRARLEAEPGGNERLRDVETSNADILAEYPVDIMVPAVWRQRQRGALLAEGRQATERRMLPSRSLVWTALPGFAAFAICVSSFAIIYTWIERSEHASATAIRGELDASPREPTPAAAARPTEAKRNTMTPSSPDVRNAASKGLSFDEGFRRLQPWDDRRAAGSAPDPVVGQRLFHDAQERLIAGDTHGAIALCREARLHGARSCSRVLGVAYEKLGNIEAACAEYERANVTSKLKRLCTTTPAERSERSTEAAPPRSRLPPPSRSLLEIRAQLQTARDSLAACQVETESDALPLSVRLEFEIEADGSVSRAWSNDDGFAATDTAECIFAVLKGQAYVPIEQQEEHKINFDYRLSKGSSVGSFSDRWGLSVDGPHQPRPRGAQRGKARKWERSGESDRPRRVPLFD